MGDVLFKDFKDPIFSKVGIFKVSTRIQPLILLFLIFFFSPDIHAFDKKTLMVPMRDGIRLATDLYRPYIGIGPWPTILIRTPYGKQKAMNDVIAAFLTDFYRYALVIQDTRGRFDSEGLDSLYFADGWGRKQDGYDTVEWIAQQTWSNQKVGTWGASALGITQYLLAGAAPPHLTCCLVMVAASNLYEDAIFYGGAYRRSLVDGWLQGHGSEHLIDFFVQHPNYEPVYDTVNLTTRYDSVNVPILHIGGWHDIFIQGQINAFCGIQDRGRPNAKGNQKLLIGPWVHDITSSTCGELSFPDAGILDLITQTVNWFDYWLKGEDNGIAQSPTVRYYLMGDADQADSPGNQWVERDDWPPPSTPTPFYLRQGGVLTTVAPTASEIPDEFDYDPDDAVPTIGGRNLNIPAGSYDQRSVESRPDVLVYTTDSLTDSLTVVGGITVTLWASSDALDTDFTAKLCDVYPDGRSMLVADGIVQARHRNSISTEELLTPGQIYEFTIDLWSTAIVFAPGHCIRLSISSSNFARFEKNPNTGEPFRQNTTSLIAHQTIFHDPDRPSDLILPVVSASGTRVASAESTAPVRPILEQNVPNPFNDETLISIHFPTPPNANLINQRKARLEIFDLRGRCLKHWTLSPQPGDRITLRWRGDDQGGRSLPSGIYLCRFTGGATVETKKMTLLR